MTVPPFECLFTAYFHHKRGTLADLPAAYGTA
jgi:hypothetical protein